LVVEAGERIRRGSSWSKEQYTCKAGVRDLGDSLPE